MIPCYQICKDINCPYWDSDSFDCSHLPDDCDHAVAHLVTPDDNQKLDGKKHGFQREWHDNGKLKYESFYDNGEIKGWQNQWHDNGQLLRQAYYVDGEVVGSWLYWAEDGSLERENVYKNGKLTGISRTWWSNGNLSHATTYLNDDHDGVSTCWKEDGTLRNDIVFKKGAMFYQKGTRFYDEERQGDDLVECNICYQICKDSNCPYWDLEMLECGFFPDECDFVAEHNDVKTDE